MPAYGNSFVTRGYIYPEGTLDDSSGVLPNGEPEFLDQVIGEWSCRGWFVGDAHILRMDPGCSQHRFLTWVKTLAIRQL